MNLSNNERSLEELIHDIKGIVSSSKNRIQQEVNNQLISTYWQIGKIISQKEKSSNQSSRQLILKLSKELTKELGKGFSRSNLFNMKTFYQK